MIPLNLLKGNNHVTLHETETKKSLPLPVTEIGHELIKKPVGQKNSVTY